MEQVETSGCFCLVIAVLLAVAIVCIGFWVFGVI